MRMPSTEHGETKKEPELSSRLLQASLFRVPPRYRGLQAESTRPLVYPTIRKYYGSHILLRSCEICQVYLTENPSCAIIRVSSWFKQERGALMDEVTLQPDGMYKIAVELDRKHAWGHLNAIRAALDRAGRSEEAQRVRDFEEWMKSLDLAGLYRFSKRPQPHGLERG